MYKSKKILIRRKFLVIASSSNENNYLYTMNQTIIHAEHAVQFSMDDLMEER